MNNLDQKVLGIEEMLDGYQEQLGNLYAKIDRIERKDEEIDDELSDLRNLVYLPFHKKGKPISLSKKITVIMILASLMTLLSTVLFSAGVGGIIYLIVHIINVGAIHWGSTLIIFIAAILAFVDIQIRKKLTEKYSFYDAKMLLNVKLFCDTNYYAERIAHKKAILERRRLDLTEEKKMAEEQIGIVSGKIDELESLLEEITDYKGKFDEEIDKMYEKNMPQKLREKIDRPFVKVKKII